MCVAGGMRDPVSMKVMRKGLVIATTSMAMHACLDPLTCIRDHEHQMIEGGIESQGLTMARSAFSEIYPRKFARLVAKQILERCFPHDKPIGSIADPALLMLDQLAEQAEALASAECVAKLMKLSPTKGRIERPPAAARASGEASSSKRLKTESQNHPNNDHDSSNQSQITVNFRIKPAYSPVTSNNPLVSPAQSRQVFPDKEIK